MICRPCSGSFRSRLESEIRGRVSSEVLCLFERPCDPVIGLTAETRASAMWALSHSSQKLLIVPRSA